MVQLSVTMIRVLSVRVSLNCSSMGLEVVSSWRYACFHSGKPVV
jgi:hypothetical protein